MKCNTARTKVITTKIIHQLQRILRKKFFRTKVAIIKVVRTKVVRSKVVRIHSCSIVLESFAVCTKVVRIEMT
jgi:hypothetical protein